MFLSQSESKWRSPKKWNHAKRCWGVMHHVKNLIISFNDAIFRCFQVSCGEEPEESDLQRLQVSNMWAQRAAGGKKRDRGLLFVPPQWTLIWVPMSALQFQLNLGHGHTDNPHKVTTHLGKYWGLLSLSSAFHFWQTSADRCRPNVASLWFLCEHTMKKTHSQKHNLNL